MIRAGHGAVLALCSLVILPQTCAQVCASDPPEIQVEDVRPLVSDAPPLALVETFLAVNPTDPANLVASAMAVSAEESVVYSSHDGGNTWEPAQVPDGRAFPGGDPMVAFDAEGRAYFATIAPDIRVWRSGDGGRTWGGPGRVGTGRSADREWVVAAPVAPGEAPTVLAVAKRIEMTQRGRQDVFVVSTSTDGGQTFAPPTLTPPDSGYLHTVTGLAVGADGTVLMAYLVNYGRVPAEEELFRGRRWIRISGDGGRSWSSPYPVAENLQYGNRSGDRAMKGLGGGGMAVDRSGGPRHGTVYMTWSAVDGGRLQIVLARSGDGGRTWSDPVRVNQGGFDADHSTPSVAVNADGVVAVTWNDRRADPNGRCFRHFVAISTDGGRSFASEQPVSDGQTCPGPGDRWLNGGDTQGLAALPDGSFRTVWSQGSGRTLQPWTAVIRVR